MAAQMVPASAEIFINKNSRRTAARISQRKLKLAAARTVLMASPIEPSS
jgi:hypothetical protein